jgi:hypothetical protein
MNWMIVVLGLVLGSCVTSALVWMQQRQAIDIRAEGYFTRVAMSVAATAILAGLLLTAVDYVQQGRLAPTGISFGTGWLLGGLIAGWALSRRPRRP